MLYEQTSGGCLFLNRKFVPIRGFLVGSDTVFEKDIVLQPTQTYMKVQ